MAAPTCSPFHHSIIPSFHHSIIPSFHRSSRVRANQAAPRSGVRRGAVRRWPCPDGHTTNLGGVVVWPQKGHLSLRSLRSLRLKAHAAEVCGSIQPQRAQRAQRAAPAPISNFKFQISSFIVTQSHRAHRAFSRQGPTGSGMSPATTTHYALLTTH